MKWKEKSLILAVTVQEMQKTKGEGMGQKQKIFMQHKIKKNYTKPNDFFFFSHYSTDKVPLQLFNILSKRRNVKSIERKKNYA